MPAPKSDDNEKTLLLNMAESVYAISQNPGGGSGDMLAANNLSDVANAATARTNLGLGTLATQSGTFSGTSSGTNTGDNAVNSNYSGLVSNATHTGDATGATALTVVAINGVNMAGLATGILKNTTTTGAPSIAAANDFPTLNQNTTGSAATLTTARAIYGNNFDGSAALTQVIGSSYGGTGNGFAKFSGPTTSEKTFTLPDSSETLLYAGGALGTPASGTLTNCTGLPIAGLTSSTSTALGVGSLELGHASDTTITRVSAGVAAIEGSNILVSGGALGTPASGTLTNCSFPTLNQNTTGYAEALKSATTTVSVSAATAPTSGQVLTATSGTAATWQTPAASSDSPFTTLTALWS